MAFTREELAEHMAQGFVPEQNTPLEMRGFIAAEYTAFFMGRIDKKLERLVELLEQKSGEA
jgi:hypothetical protein